MREPDPRSAAFPPPGTPPLAPGSGEMLAVRVPGRGFTTTALTFAAVTVVLPLAVVLAVGFAVAGQRRGDPWGRRAIIASVVAFVAGLVVTGVANTIDTDAFGTALVHLGGAGR